LRQECFNSNIMSNPTNKPLNDYDAQVKAMQAQYMADLRREMAKAEPDKLRAQRYYFLMSLIKARVAKKVTQKQLADLIGMQQSAISRIESGKGNPSMNTLLKIAKTLDVNLVVE